MLEAIIKIIILNVSLFISLLVAIPIGTGLVKFSKGFARLLMFVSGGALMYLSFWLTNYESLHRHDPKHQNNETYLIELLSEIAKSLGYNHLTPSKIADFYIPEQFGQTISAANEVQTEFLRVLKSSENFGIRLPPQGNSSQDI